MGVIRFLLALSVIITHSTPLAGISLMNGDMAVTCFFIVSGFLMTFILEEKYVGKTKQFAINRILRIYPAYLASLVFAMAFYYFIPNGHHNPYNSLSGLLESDGLLLFFMSITTNLTLLGADLSRYLNFTPVGEFIFPNFLHRGEGNSAHNLLFVPQAWTLPIELMFYLLAPWIVRFKTSRIFLLLALLSLLYYLAWTYAGEVHMPFDPSSFFPLQLPYFVLGVLACRGWKTLKVGIDHKKIWVGYVPKFSFMFAVFLLFAGYTIHKQTEISPIYIYLLFAFSLPGVFEFGKLLSYDTPIGEYSYPMYLFHYPISKTVDQWVSPAYEGWLTLIMTLVVCAVYIQWVDRHIQRVRFAIARR